MKEIIKSILAAVFIYGSLYLSVSFINGNINCNEWDEGSRGFIMLFGGIFWAFSLLLIFSNKTNESIRNKK